MIKEYSILDIGECHKCHTHEEVTINEDCENTDLLQEDEYCHTAGLVCDFFLAAPIAEEILKELPAQYEEGATKPWLTCAKNRANEFEVGYMTTKAGFIDGHITNKSLAEAAAICWIYLKKNNLI